MRYLGKKRVFMVILCIMTCFLYPQTIYAKEASLGFSPTEGTYDSPFSIALVADSDESFNAIQADIVVSQNLRVNDLTLGDCNLTFLENPSMLSPSFSGVILNGHANHCTVYTMTVVPIDDGNGTVTISASNMKRFGDAVNIFHREQTGTYVMTKYAGARDGAYPTISEPTEGLYTLVLKLTDPDNMPLSNVSVHIQNTEKSVELNAKTDDRGIVQFPNISGGIYVFRVPTYTHETILNVSGPAHTIMMGIILRTNKVFDMPSVLLLFAAILALIMGGVLVYTKKTQRLKQKQ